MVLLIGLILGLFAVRVLKWAIKTLYKYAPFIVAWCLIFLAIIYLN